MKDIIADCFGQIFFDLKGRSDHPNPPPCRNVHNKCGSSHEIMFFMLISLVYLYLLYFSFY